MLLSMSLWESFFKTTIFAISILSQIFPQWNLADQYTIEKVTKREQASKLKPEKTDFIFEIFITEKGIKCWNLGLEVLLQLYKQIYLLSHNNSDT